MKTRKITGKQESEANARNHNDYDSAWKDVIEDLFERFLEFFFPEIYRDIDFTRKVQFLGKELRTIKAYGNAGKRYADELVKVYLKDGSAACICIFIHIEVQGSRVKKGLFEERTFIYNYRIFDKYIGKDRKVISLAILTDEDPGYRPNEYISNQWGFELRMKFPLVKLVDYKIQEDLIRKLENSRNPMAMVVKAHLKNFELKNADNETKSTVKWEFIRQCYERGYSKKEIQALVKFFDWLIRLPEELEQQLSEKILKIEEDYKMPYVTSFERLAEKRGEKRGEERGEKRGEKRAKKEMAIELLKSGFDINIIARTVGFPLEEIKKLATTH